MEYKVIEVDLYLNKETLLKNYEGNLNANYLDKVINEQAEEGYELDKMTTFSIKDKAKCILVFRQKKLI